MKATGTVSEFNLLTEITATTAASVVVTDAGNHLAEVTPATITLPIAGDVDAYYEAREGMKVTFVDTLIGVGVLRARALRPDHPLPRAAGRASSPRPTRRASRATPPGPTASRAAEVILDDDNNAQEWYLTTSSPPGPADGLQYVYYPRANGGFSVGTQGTDFFRGGDLVNGLTGVLHWSFAGQAGTDAWRIRPTAAQPGDLHRRQPAPGDAAGGGRRHPGGGHEPPQLLHDDRHHREQLHRSLRPERRPWTAAAPTASPSSTASARGRRSSSARSTPTSTASWSSRTPRRAPRSPTCSARSTPAAAARIRTPS